MGIYCRSWVYTASPSAIGSHDGYILPQLGIYRLPFCDWFSQWVYTAAAGYIPPPLLRLVLTM
eukprot:2549163-Pyramimonas_sp.AAC.1